MTFVVALQLERDNARHVQMQLDAAARVTFDQIEDAIYRYQYGLRGMRGVALTAGDGLSAEQVLRYSHSRDSTREFRGARGFGFIRRVAQADEAGFVETQRAAGRPAFRVRTLAPHDGDRFIIQFVEPLASNAAAVGLDIGSESLRRTAAWSAAQSGESRLTGPITLVQADKQRAQSFLMLLPVYRDGATPPTVALREQQLVGWAYAPLLMSQVLQALKLDPGRIELALSDEGANGVGIPFFRSASHEAFADAPHTSLDHDVMGRRWRMHMAAGPDFVASNSPWSVRTATISGALLSLLAAALALALGNNRLRRRQIARDQANMIAVVQSSADGIIGQSIEGVVTSWNRAAEQLFGYSHVQAIGRRLGDLIVPVELQAEDESVLARIARGEEVPYFETVRRHADGRMLDVLISISPIYNAAGKPVGASKTVRDVSEQKAAHAQILALNSTLESQVALRTAELRRSTLMLEGVLSAASEVSIIATDCTGMITLFNTGSERLLGYRREEVEGLVSPALFHVADEVIARGAELGRELGIPVQGFRVFVEKVERDGAETREWTYIRKDGGTRQVSLAVTAIRDELGDIVGYLGIALDISERKAAERSLARNMALTQAILDTAVNPIITFDVQGKVRSLNRAGDRVFGYAASEVIGQDVRMLMPEAYTGQRETPKVGASAAGAALVEGIDGGRELQALRKDGTTLLVEMSLGTMWMDGECLLVAVVVDITERDRQRRALTRARDQLAMAADAAQIGIWTWTPGNGALECNERMFEIYDWPVELRERGPRYEDWRCMVHPDDIGFTEDRLQNALDGTGIYDPVFRILRNDGTLRHIQGGAHTERDAQGQVTLVIGINRDITAQLASEHELREAKARADEASQAKSSFLANMSHEIRTPMNAVLGMLQLLQRTTLDLRQSDYVGKAQKAGKSLLSLLNDILDYSKIEAGKLQLDLHPFGVEELFRDLSVVLSGNRKRPEVEIVYQLDQRIPERLMGDTLRLQQVLINLAGNALKFTEQGYVLLRLELLQRQSRSVTLRIAVEDTGIGISDEQQQRIFQSFTQAEASISRRFGGSGLGLVISRRLIGLMGGELQVTSRLGEGSRFWFDLTMQLDVSGGDVESCGSGASQHVLVVDDSQLVREVLTESLSVRGWRVASADCGEDALALAVAADERGDGFDAVLMDWRLPGMDGITTAAAIGAACTRCAAPRVLMLTAYQSELLSAVQRDAQVPFVDYLIKPVTPCQVVEVVERALVGSASPAALEYTPVPFGGRLPGLRVLVVEDNALNRQVAEELLGAEGAVVELAEDGFKGVHCVQHGERTFDVVVMDMQMPHMDGLEATRRIRADARFAHLPILAVTANAAQDDVGACLQAGMNAHIGKPIDLEQMVAALLRLTGRDAGEMSAERAAVAPAASLDAILARFGNNHDLFLRMLDAFAEDHRALLQQVSSALMQRDLTGSADAAHALKGSAATMGAARLAEAASVLERMARAGQLPEAEVALAELETLAEQDLLELHRDADPLRSHLVDSVTVSGEALQSWLRRLQPLLRASDLAALDVLGQAPAVIDGPQAKRYKTFLQQVQNLQFDAALMNLNILLERPCP